MTQSKTKANIFVVLGILASILLSAGIITYSIMQGRDMKASFYDKSFCQDTVLNQHRPFQAQLSFHNQHASANETESYKVCNTFLVNNGKSGNLTTCLFPTTPRTKSGDIDKDQMVLHCGWSTRQQVRRLSIVSSQIVAVLFGIVWVVFAAKSWGKIIGLVYTALVAASAVGLGWLAFTDIHAILQSRNWCNSYYAKSLCNVNPQNPTMNCTCYYATYSGTAILDIIGVIVYLYLLGSCIYRKVTYLHKEDEGFENLDDKLSQLDNGEKESLTSSSRTSSSSTFESPSERRAREIYSSYNYQ